MLKYVSTNVVNLYVFLHFCPPPLSPIFCDALRASHWKVVPAGERDKKGVPSKPSGAVVPAKFTQLVSQRKHLLHLTYIFLSFPENFEFNNINHIISFEGDTCNIVIYWEI